MSKTRVLHVYMQLITANSKQYGVVQLNKRIDFILKTLKIVLFLQVSIPHVPGTC